MMKTVIILMCNNQPVSAHTTLVGFMEARSMYARDHNLTYVKPSTYFGNGTEHYLHKVEVPYYEV